MTDAAETCGHDDCIDDWNAAVKKAMKVFPNYEERKKEINEKLHQKREELHKKKEAAYLEKQRKEDADLLASFGLGLSADGKIEGL